MRVHAGLVRYLLLVVVVGTVSLWLSYDVGTSDAWYWAYGAKGTPEGGFRNLGGGLEGVRLVLLCGLFYVVMTGLFPVELRYAWGRSTFPKRLLRPTGSWVSRLGAALWIGGTLFVVVFHAWAAPLDLESGFTAAVAAQVEVAGQPAFERYFLPYLLYLPYSVCTYLMLAVPLLLVMVIGIRHDRGKLRTLLERVDRRTEGDTAAVALRLRQKIDYVYGNLRRVMNRYGWVLLLLAVYYVIEFFTPMFDTLSCMAQVSTSWSAWLFVLVIVPYFFLRTYRRFHRGNRVIQRVLGRLGQRAVEEGDGEALDQVDKVRERVKTDSLVGYFTLFRQTSVVLMVGTLLTVGVLGAVVKRYVEGERIRDTVNRVLPVPVDYGAILLIDLFTTVETEEEGFEYRTCFETPAPPAEVVRRFPPAGG